MAMPPRTDWKESIAPDEKERFEGYGRLLAAMQAKAARGPRPDRALHAKEHLGVRARFTVLPDAPPHFRVGIFAAPASFDAWVRFSNGAGRRQDDHKGDVRGMAVKVLGVPGKKIIPGMEDAPTQDFLLIQSATLKFKNADEFMFFVAAAQRPATLLFKAALRFGLGRTLSILSDFARKVSAPVASAADLRYFSPLPVRWGAHAAKYSAVPVAPSGKHERGVGVDYLGDELRERLARGPIEFDFAAQAYVDPSRTPIEDASVPWSEEDSPFVPVARITLLQQNLGAEAWAAQNAYVDGLSFDPWHAPVEFRPLGDMMRARSETYRVSTIARKASPEPASFPSTIP